MRVWFLSALVVFALVLPAVPGSAFASGAHGRAHAPQSYYLALGDSLAQGYQVSTVPTDRACTDSANDKTGNRGYVCLFWQDLKTINPSIQLENLGLAVSPGEDTCSFATTTPCAGGTRSAAVPTDHPPYDIAHEPQLTAALDFLRAHPGQVSPITLDLGGDDLSPLLGLALSKGVSAAQAQLPAVMNRIRTNYDAIVGRLRAAAPAADIILINQYNPISGLPAAVLGAQGQTIEDLATSTLQQFGSIVKAEAAAVGGAYADVYTPFLGRGPQLTWIAFNTNVHPTGSGYTVYAAAVWQAYETYLKQSKPGGTLSVSIHVSQRPAHMGQAENITVQSSPHVAVRLTLTFAHKTWKKHGTTDGTGTFQRSWHAPKHKGKAHVRACATEAKQHTCASTSFKVR